LDLNKIQVNNKISKGNFKAVEFEVVVAAEFEVVVVGVVEFEVTVVAVESEVVIVVEFEAAVVAVVVGLKVVVVVKLEAVVVVVELEVVVVVEFEVVVVVSSSPQKCSPGTKVAAKVPLGSVRFPVISHSPVERLNFSTEFSFFPSSPPNACTPPSSTSISKSCLAILRLPVSIHSPNSKSKSSEVLNTSSFMNPPATRTPVNVLFFTTEQAKLLLGVLRLGSCSAGIPKVKYLVTVDTPCSVAAALITRKVPQESCTAQP